MPQSSTCSLFLIPQSSTGSLLWLHWSSARSFSVALVYSGCMLECHVRTSLSSAGQARGSPWADRALSLALLAADAGDSLGTAF